MIEDTDMSKKTNMNVLYFLALFLDTRNSLENAEHVNMWKGI